MATKFPLNQQTSDLYSQFRDYLSGTAGEALKEVYGGGKKEAQEDISKLLEAIGYSKDYKEAFQSGVMNIQPGYIASSATNKIISDALKEFSNKSLMFVSKKGRSFIEGIGTYEYPKGLYKSPSKLAGGIEEIKMLQKEFIPGIRGTREGLQAIENFEPVQKLYAPIKDVEGLLYDPIFSGRFYPRWDKIKFTTGRTYNPSGSSQDMLHELFHKHLENPNTNVIRDLERQAPYLTSEFLERNPNTRISDRGLSHIVKPEELLVESTAQNLYNKLLGQPPPDFRSKISWEEYRNWPKPVSDYISGIISKLGD